mgnify:CR=1 FL=1
MKMIYGASLINRFYRRDGWTAERVASLLNKPDVGLITFRESYLDDIDISYYAYYERPDDEVHFLRSKIEECVFVPFMGNTFEENNKLV